MNAKIIASNVKRMGNKLSLKYNFPVFELETMGYFITTIVEDSAYAGSITISDKSDSSKYINISSFVGLDKNGYLRIVTNGNPDDHSFYTEKIKEVLEYLSEPRWILVLSKTSKNT